MEINILGTTYKILKGTAEEYQGLKENDGACDVTVKEIYIADPEKETLGFNAVKNMDVVTKRIIRHEIIHAFFYESGLFFNSDYGTNEELIDWIAIQLPKLIKVMYEAEAF